MSAFGGKADIRVVRGKVKLTPMQQRMLIELLPFYMPKLSCCWCWVHDQQHFC
jgi:hypothetical protein